MTNPTPERTPETDEIKKLFGWDLMNDGPNNPRNKFFFEADAEKIASAIRTERQARETAEGRYAVNFKMLQVADKQIADLKARLEAAEKRVAELEGEIAMTESNFEMTYESQSERISELEGAINKCLQSERIEYWWAETLQAALSPSTPSPEPVPCFCDFEHAVPCPKHDDPPPTPEAKGTEKCSASPLLNKTDCPVCNTGKSVGPDRVREALEAASEFRELANIVLGVKDGRRSADINADWFAEEVGKLLLAYVALAALPASEGLERVECQTCHGNRFLEVNHPCPQGCDNGFVWVKGRKV